MALIIWFLALVAAGDVLAYLVGLFVEYQWGGYTSLVVFLAMYFITLWVAWRIAVWMTTPKLVPDSTGAGGHLIEPGLVFLDLCYQSLSRPRLSTLQPQFSHVHPPQNASRMEVALRTVGKGAAHCGHEAPNSPSPRN